MFVSFPAHRMTSTWISQILYQVISKLYYCLIVNNNDLSIVHVQYNYVFKMMSTTRVYTCTISLSSFTLTIL